MGLKHDNKSAAGGEGSEFQSWKCADATGILSKSEERGRATEVKIKRAWFKNLVVF